MLLGRGRRRPRATASRSISLSASCCEMYLARLGDRHAAPLAARGQHLFEEGPACPRRSPRRPAETPWIMAAFSLTSISTSRSSSLPSRSMARRRSRARCALLDASRARRRGDLAGLGRGCRAGAPRRSVSAWPRTWAAMLGADHVDGQLDQLADHATRRRGRGSRPRCTWLASTLMKGALARPARRRAISVLPTPVGPIMMMFFGGDLVAQLLAAAAGGASGCAGRRRRRAWRRPGRRCTGRAAARWRGASAPSWQRLDPDVTIGVDAYVGRDLE